VGDDQKVLSILAKSTRGIALTETELNALDPDHSEKGINKTQLFDDMLSEIKNHEPYN
jgi:hypothetical protein